MSFDGFYTKAMTAELSSNLLGGKIQKIYQPFEQELIFVIRSNRKTFRMQASVHPTYYRLHLTEDRPNNPIQAPMFCMLLRKHLENSEILDIRQIENDRIVEFELSGRDELGDLHTYTLIFELMGRHSNIILLNPATGKIIDCIKHIPPSMNTYRSLQPGAEYIRPPRNEQQTNIFSLNAEELNDFVQNNEALIISRQAPQLIQGLSGIAAKQIRYWFEHDNLSVSAAVKKFIEQFKQVMPLIFYSENKMQFYAFDLTYIEGQREPYATLSDSLDIFYREKVHFDRVKQVSGNMIQRVQQIIDKNKVKLIRLQKDRKKAESADTYRIQGELLNAYAHEISKGLVEAEVLNYYTNEPYVITLNPRKDAVDNAQTYFKKYTKYRDSLKYIDKQVSLAKAENDYLESILVHIEQGDVEDIEDIKAELEREGYLKKPKKGAKKRAQSKSKPRRYRSSDGIMIYVGRNNQQNDDLSMKKASKNHWWLHTKDIPGAHVIVESDQPSDQTMTEAAQIAAYHSRSQDSANVPVDTVQVKQLRKPNGAKPGFVIYEGQNTLYVTPVEAEIKKLEIDK